MVEELKAFGLDYISENKLSDQSLETTTDLTKRVSQLLLLKMRRPRQDNKSYGANVHISLFGESQTGEGLLPRSACSEDGGRSGSGKSGTTRNPAKNASSIDVSPTVHT